MEYEDIREQARYVDELAEELEEADSLNSDLLLEYDTELGDLAKELYNNSDEYGVSIPRPKDSLDPENHAEEDLARLKALEGQLNEASSVENWLEERGVLE